METAYKDLIFKMVVLLPTSYFRCESVVNTGRGLGNVAPYVAHFLLLLLFFQLKSCIVSRK